MSDRLEVTDHGMLLSYDAFRRDVERRKTERWAEILNGEPPGRPIGRRPRDPDKERLLAELDRRRLQRLGVAAAGDS